MSTFKDILRDKVSQARQANTHPAKFIILTDLLRELFGVQLDVLLPGIEKKLGRKVYGIKGRADLVFHSVVFEVKVDLTRELDDAKNQLKKYLQALIEQEHSGAHLGIATDVVEFRAYKPVIKNGEVKDLREISSIDISQVSAEDAVLWLDSYIFHKIKGIRPTAADLKYRFGPQSPTYTIAIDSLEKMFELVKNEPSVKLKLDLWKRNMEIVYGSEPELKAFLDQTYLVTLVKLIVYFRLSGETTVRKEQIEEALTGEYFTSHGILNLIEEDFFTWILHEKIRDEALNIFTGIAKEIARYDITQIDEDLFKEIYQEIVERGQKHRIGEYYTPEWLVEITLREAIQEWQKIDNSEQIPRILDPACGSGTFLTNSIHMLKRILTKKGITPSEALEFIINNIVGMDINPLAVVIARANYLIALGDLLRLGYRITIPVYISDAIKLPKVQQIYAYASGENIDVYDIELKQYKVHIQIPVSIANDRVRLSEALAGLREAINNYRNRKQRDEAVKVFENNVARILNDAEIEALSLMLDTIFALIDKKLDEIWVFMLNNIYASTMLSNSKFDILASNPPWIAMRYVENKEYQDFLKEQVLKYDLLSSDETHLFTHMEMATLFFCRTADLYLKDKGIIAFVMPRSVLTGAFQHIRFKSLSNPPMKLLKIFDLEGVQPLFNVPSCVLIARKGELMGYPVLARRLSGRLEAKNERLNTAMNKLRAEDYQYEPPTIPVGTSYYHDLVKQGATIVPRNLWFIEFTLHKTLGIDSKRPLVRTSKLVAKEAKKPWKGITLEGNIEAEFIYATLLGGDLVPFGFTTIRPVVLPIKSHASSYILLDVDELRTNGFNYMAEWLEKAQRIWGHKATKRALNDYPRVIRWLDYLGKLTNQNPNTKYVVLYNTSGTNLVSCVINKDEIRGFKIDNIIIPVRGFVVESKTYFYETNNEDEAHYICAILNSDIVNEGIKPLQPRGLYGERDIHRRPFVLPIPKFDKKNTIHKKLAELSKLCHSLVSKMTFRSTRPASARKQVRDALKEQINEINSIAEELLGMRG